MKIAIDGPSASGKGTISKILGEKIGAAVLNTGAIYRVVAFEASRMEGNLEENAISIALDIESHYHKNLDNDTIYTESNAVITSQIAKNTEVRFHLLSFQRRFAEINKRAILEGRDIGSVILPKADFKFYLDASLEERARRRALQIPESDEKSILALLKERDNNDKSRKEAALIIPEEAHYIDTTSLNPSEVILSMLAIINK